MMGRNSVVRLDGADDDVIAVAQQAARVVWPFREFRREVFPLLDALYRGRREFIDAPVSSRPAKSSDASPRWWRWLWWTLLSLSLIGVCTAVAMFGPPGRKNRFIDPELAAGVAVPAFGIALVIGVLLLMLPLPSGARVRDGAAVAFVLSIFVGLAIGYRLLAGVSDTRGFTVEQLNVWFIGAVPLLLVLLAFAWRARRFGRYEPSESIETNSNRARTGRSLRRRAIQLAGMTPAVVTERAEVGQEWTARLDRLADRRGVPHNTLAQARELGPIGWLAWTHYDGEIDVSGIRPRR